MRIGIIGSLQFAQKFVDISKQLEQMGHDPFTTKYIEQFISSSPEEIEKLKLDFEEDSLSEFWETMKGADALLVLNYDKRDIENYIGGSTLIEMAMGKLQGMKLFLINPVPEIPYYYDEILSMEPIILDGDLKKIK